MALDCFFADRIVLRLGTRALIECSRSSREAAGMPELPEVETMVRGVRRALAGAVLERLEVLDPSLLQNRGAEDFVRSAEGAVVESVERRGKWVILRL